MIVKTSTSPPMLTPEQRWPTDAVDPALNHRYKIDLESENVEIPGAGLPS